MASFLQNNGDIILDAVLTDYGRRLLAKGDGSFNIVKYAFGDDEIDYSLYKPLETTINKDADIMNTPILEAFTNNAASMKSTLMTMGPGAENTLFLPILKLNTVKDAGKIGQFKNAATGLVVYTGHVIPVDVTSNSTQIKTSHALSGSEPYKYIEGVLNVDNRMIIVEQGLDSNELDPDRTLKTDSPPLYETEYNIRIDNRFCSLGMYDAGQLMASQPPISIDDDNMATYKINEMLLQNNMSHVSQIPVNTDSDKSVINGTKGSRAMFTLMPNNNLLYTNSMFEKYGKNLYLNENQQTKQFRTIRTTVRIEGVNTGVMLEIPVLFAKLIQ